MVSTIGLSGSGTLDVDDDNTSKPTVYNMTVTILNPDIEQAPSVLLASVSEAIQDVMIDFYIDATLVYSVVANSQGLVPTVSIELTASMGTVGSHTLTVRQTGAVTATATFTIDNPPPIEPTAVGQDAEPVEIPEALTSGGVRRWVFQDLLPEANGGIGSWVMPMNPSEMTSPFMQANLSSFHTTAMGQKTAQPNSAFPQDGGQYHVFEGSVVPQDWTFKGYCPTKEMHDKLLEYRDLNRRIYIIDHRNRAWKVAIVNVDFTMKLRQIWQPTGEVAMPTDWGADFEVTCVVLSQTYAVPQ